MIYLLDTNILIYPIKNQLMISMRLRALRKTGRNSGEMMDGSS